MASDVTLNAGAGGAIIRTDPTTSSEHFQMVKLAYGDTGTFNFVSTSLPLPIINTSNWTVVATGPTSLTSGTVTLSSAIGISSGIVQMSSVQVINSASSGFVQILIPINSSAGFAPVTSSGGQLVWTASSSLMSLTSAIGISSGIVSPSSNWTVVLSSQPGLSSGTVTLSSNPTVISASSGFVQILIPINSSAGFAPVTSSGGQLVWTASSSLMSLTSAIGISSGIVSPSSNWTVVLSSQPGLSSGTVTLSSNPTVISASSGFVQALFPINSSAGFGPVTSSGGVLVWTASSSLVAFTTTPVVQTASSSITGLLLMTSSGESMFNWFTSGTQVVTNITTAASNLKSYMLFNSTLAGYSVKVYNTTGPTAGSTTNMVLALFAPGGSTGGSGGGGANMTWRQGPYSSNGWSIAPTALLDATSTGAVTANQSINFTYQT